MARRLTYDEKGKGVAQTSEPLRSGRILVPEGCPELVEQRRVNARNVHLRDREPLRQDRYQVPRARHNHDERRDNQYREKQGQRRSVGPYDSRGTRAYETGSKGDRSYLKEGAHHNSSRREERWVDSGRRFPTTNRTVDSFGSRSGEPFSETGRRNLNKERQPNNPEDGVIPRSPLKSVKTHVPRAAPQLEEIPNEVLEVVREELREVMIQYTSCADPTESAARRERVRRAEEQGEVEEVEETAENMARQMLNVQRTWVQAESPEVVPPRVPATCRLGGVSLSDQEGEISSQQGRVSAKKRLGRPPVVRKLGVISTRAGAASTKSRKVAQLKGSPKRRVGRQTVNSKKTELLNQAVGASTSNPKTKKPKGQLPPEPRGWPFIGNLFHMLMNRPAHVWIHRSMEDMQTKIGCFRFARVHVITVTSSEIAREVLREKDEALADRSESYSRNLISHGYKEVIFSSYGESWKLMKKMMITKLMSPTMLSKTLDDRTLEADNIVTYVFNLSLSGSINEVG
uniref:Uncharacterized protein n=1 Tax=Brassica oleracea var. oleracea TaxID=109376 RepID=A0A0D3CSM2_BRAOL